MSTAALSIIFTAFGISLILAVLLGGVVGAFFSAVRQKRKPTQMATRVECVVDAEEEEADDTPPEALVSAWEAFVDDLNRLLRESRSVTEATAQAAERTNEFKSKLETIGLDEQELIENKNEATAYYRRFWRAYQHNRKHA